MYVHRHMSSPPVTIGPQMPILEVREVLRSRSFRHLPVVDEQGRLIGMVTDRDIRSAYPSSMLAENELKAVLDQLAHTPVSAIMSRDIVSLPPLATLDDALFLLEQRGVGAVPVVDFERRVLGVFSIRDLLTAYRKLFGAGMRGSALVEIKDDRKPLLLSRIIQTLEAKEIPFTRLVRTQEKEDEAWSGTIYLRVNTFNIMAVHAVLREAGFEPVLPHS